MRNKRYEQWEMQKKSEEGRNMRFEGEKCWGQGKMKYKKRNRKRKRKLEKEELSRMKVRNKSEAEMRIGKALLKAKGRNVWISRERPATDPETLEISITSEHANQDNGTVIKINNLPQDFSASILKDLQRSSGELSTRHLINALIYTCSVLFPLVMRRAAEIAVLTSYKYVYIAALLFWSTSYWHKHFLSTNVC